MRVKKIVVFDIVLAAIILIGTVLLFALGAYFLEDRFSTDDAAPLADPHTSTGGQSVDVAEVDGSLAISGGKLTMTKQTSAVSGDLGMRYNSSKTGYIGAAAFFKIVPKEMNDGSGDGGASATFGFSDDTNLLTASAAPGSICTDANQFLMFPNDQNLIMVGLVTTPSLNDTFCLAILNGGHDEGASGLVTSVPWYSGGGLNLANFNEGKLVFIRKNNGLWLLNGVDPVYSRNSRFSSITSKNSTFEIYDWLVLGDSDSLYNPYMQPIHYQSGTASNGQLFDDTPEVGAAYDSVTGDFNIVSNIIVATIATEAMTTADMGDDDVLGEILTSIDNASTGRYTYMVLRRNSATGEHILIGLSTTTDNMQIFSYNGSSYTSRASTGVSMGTGSAFKILLQGAVYDSTVYAWYHELGEFFSLTYTSGANTFYSAHSTRHGVRMGDNTTGIKFMRWRAMGNDGEYAGLNDILPLSSSSLKRRRMLPQ